MQFDHKSVLGCLATIFCSVFSNITQSGIMFWVTMIAALTTIIYNIIKIKKELKP